MGKALLWRTCAARSFSSAVHPRRSAVGVFVADQRSVAQQILYPLRDLLRVFAAKNAACSVVAD